MKDIDSLETKLAELRAEYDRAGRPLLNAIIETAGQIRDIKREQGKLFYVEYMRYRSKCTEERDDLEGAKGCAEALEDAGDGYVVRIYGPGVELTKEFGGDW